MRQPHFSKAADFLTGELRYRGSPVVVVAITFEHLTVPEAILISFGNPHSPQSFNLFAYVRGNPVTYWDPWGFDITQDPTNPFHFNDSLDVIGVDPRRVAAWGWLSRDNFAFGTPRSGGGGGGGSQVPYADGKH
ncbi:MAG: hypothetical protein GXP48_02030 [Acidobacteria bacterium]|nr:hypothetical protein [Acidobacteriota bacterium]